MTDSNVKSSNTVKTALITGAARRIGAETARQLHQAGYNVIIHYNSSGSAAEELARSLNDIREASATTLQGSLDDYAIYEELVKKAQDYWGRLDVLVNNASTFYPTPVGSITLDDWDRLINSNMKAPLFLSQAAAPYLKQTRGCIVNMIDVHAQRPMKNHTVYCAAKAGVSMITLSLAKELGPEIRVNGVAPGAILWPENDLDEETRSQILERTALKRPGEPSDIARTILFLAQDAGYITGQVIAVDGGRTINI